MTICPFKLLLALLGLLLLPFLNLGCTNLFDAHVKEFDLMRGMAADAASRLEDGGVAQMQVSGQALNPGIQVEAAVVYRAVAKYDGLAGQFGVASHGVLGGRTLPDAVLAIINDSSKSEAQRIQLLKDLIDALKTETTTQPTQ